MKPGLLLLLLAVTASWVDLSLSESVSLNITSCPITFYGLESTWINITTAANSSLSVCFGNSPGTTPDCLLLEDAGGSQLLEIGTDLDETSLSDFKSKSPCYSWMVASKTAGRSAVGFNIYNLGAQAAIKTFPYSAYTAVNFNFSVTVGGSTVDSWSYTKEEAQSKPVKDISGCRVSGEVYLPGSAIGNCSNLMCDKLAVIKNVSSCGSRAVCQGNNICIPLPYVCTVTGSTVIDFHGRVHSVQDRCAYKLMVHSSQIFRLSARFRERRRQDVLFLDHLILSTKGTEVVLEQGGRVRIKDQAVTLNATAQLLGGVEISKDNSGVTAKMPSSNMTLFFDGNVAHISGFAEDVKGLCGNSTDSSLKTTPYQELNTNIDSGPGCDVQYNDTVDSSINCTRSTEHCKLLRQAPFTACHDDIDPEPYITACKNTLCNYPMVDALNCQFFEAYAKACSLAFVTVEGWRSTSGCPALPQAFCLDQYCSDHEFCGEKLGGTRCLCRAIFSAKYKARNALGEPTVCTSNSATVSLAGCLLEEKGIDYSVLGLNDRNCTGHMDYQTHMVTFSYNSSDMCGTEVTTNNSQIMYKNSIATRNGTNSEVITRHDQVQIDFSCFYKMPDIRSVSFRIKDSSVVQHIISGVWNYTLMMSAYTDAGRTNLIAPSTEIQLNQKVWMELKTEGLEGDMVAIVTDSCWATSQSSPGSKPRYNLIINKCPSHADQTVNVVGNGLGTSNFFSFSAFQFSGETSDVYLHCQVELCPTQGQSCAPSCGGVRRKARSMTSKYADGSPALITMTWSS